MKENALLCKVQGSRLDSFREDAGDILASSIKSLLFITIYLWLIVKGSAVI